MSTKHTPEPWDIGDKAAKYGTIDQDERQKCYRLGVNPDFQAISIGNKHAQIALIPLDNEWAQANAARIVECVNACENFTSEFLNADGINKLLGYRYNLLNENEQLKQQIQQIESLCSRFMSTDMPRKTFWENFNAIIGINSGGGGNG